MNADTTDQPSGTEPAHPPKVRHPDLTLLLWWLLFVNVVVAIGGPFAIPMLRRNMPDFQLWMAWLIAALGAYRVACIVALFRWKRWGFYGYAAASVAEMAINIYAGVAAVNAPLWLIGTAVLFGLLQLGHPKSGWAQLERRTQRISSAPN